MSGRQESGETAGAALAQATRQLAAAGIDSARLDAELLLAQVLERERAQVLAHPELVLTPGQEARLRALLQRRAKREPLAYLRGRRWFFGLEFEVTPAVLIPRPETELLVEAAITWLGKNERPGMRAIDVGTGSGAIAISLAAHTGPNLHLLASDVSAEALAVARANAARHSLSSRITFLQGDLLSPLPGPVDLILANLPYVAEEERETLMPEVREYEPGLALFSGPHGLGLIERLLGEAPAYLRPGGALFLEIGQGQGPAVAALARRAFPQARIELRPDLAGIDRVVAVQTAALPLAIKEGKENDAYSPIGL